MAWHDTQIAHEDTLHATIDCLLRIKRTHAQRFGLSKSNEFYEAGITDRNTYFWFFAEIQYHKYKIDTQDV